MLTTTSTTTNNASPTNSLSGFVITKSDQVFTETVTLLDLVTAYRNGLKLWSIPGSTTTYWDSQPESPYDVVALDPRTYQMSNSTSTSTSTSTLLKAQVSSSPSLSSLPAIAALKLDDYDYQNWEQLHGKRKVYLEIPFLDVTDECALT